MKIAVRLDDITPDMNWDNFNFFRDLFKETGITPLLGIVPENQDENLTKGVEREDFFEVMRALGQEGYSFALHGCYHVYTTKKGGLFPLNHFSEFAGVPYEKQKEMIEKGRDKLKAQGIVTDIFMAPAHSYDRNTLRALKEAGFNKITDGFGDEPYHDFDMDFYPISFKLSRSLRKNKGLTTMVIHANSINEADRERYLKIFKENGKDMISYSEYLKYPVVRRGIWGRCKEYLLANFKRIMVFAGKFI